MRFFDKQALDRRAFLAGLGCSAAAAPFATPVALAQAPGENRLVVVVLRGAMDGLAAVEPYGDRALSDLRPDLALGGDRLIDVDGRFGLHPSLSPIGDWVARGELAAVHAVSTPYRDGRSHFDGQDLLETGGARLGGAGDGWLNRALARMDGARLETAIAIGREHMLILDGAAPALSWAPESRLSLGEDARGLLDALYAGDPLFAAAYADAAMLGELGAGGADAREARGPAGLARFAAEMLSGAARIAAFSITGWDTHRAQTRTIERPLAGLAEALIALRDGLGGHWERTLVLAITEFGRTARANGVGGTDHGTGGAALLAGGALAGGRVFGRWPGLDAGDLYEDRDLAPTDDVRRYAGHALRGLFGLSTAAIENEVFPGASLGDDPGFLA